MSTRFNRLAFAAAALGLAMAGSAVATSSAEASPRHGGWGHHGHGSACTGFPRPVCTGGGWGHGGGWGGGHGGGWGGGWGGTTVIGGDFPYGVRCQFVERYNRWGEIVVRRVCRPAHWR